MAEQCSFRVYSGARWDMGGHRCGNPAKHEREGKWLCARHTPEAIAKRKAASSAKCNTIVAGIREQNSRNEEMRQRAAEWPQLKQHIAELEAERTRP